MLASADGGRHAPRAKEVDMTPCLNRVIRLTVFASLVVNAGLAVAQPAPTSEAIIVEEVAWVEHVGLGGDTRVDAAITFRNPFPGHWLPVTRYRIDVLDPLGSLVATSDRHVVAIGPQRRTVDVARSVDVGYSEVGSLEIALEAETLRPTSSWMDAEAEVVASQLMAGSRQRVVGSLKNTGAAFLDQVQVMAIGMDGRGEVLALEIKSIGGVASGEERPFSVDFPHDVDIETYELFTTPTIVDGLF